jgi:hypothetical protein
MGLTLPQPVKPLKELSPVERLLDEKRYTPEQLSAFGPSADTIRRLFKNETEGVTRLNGPAGKGTRKYCTMSMSESAVLRVLGSAFFANPKT